MGSSGVPRVPPGEPPGRPIPPSGPACDGVRRASPRPGRTGPGRGMSDLERGGTGALRMDLDDPDAGSLHDQLKVFAREVGVLYSAERVRRQELEHALQSARQMYLATMKSLAHVVEAKDPTTRGHLDRTAHYGLALAREVDPALADRPEVAWGFFLHDIGKVGIPESILCKAGPLTELE